MDYFSGFAEELKLYYQQKNLSQILKDLAISAELV